MNELVDGRAADVALAHHCAAVAAQAQMPTRVNRQRARAVQANYTLVSSLRLRERWGERKLVPPLQAISATFRCMLTTTTITHTQASLEKCSNPLRRDRSVSSALLPASASLLLFTASSYAGSATSVARCCSSALERAGVSTGGTARL